MAHALRVGHQRPARIEAHPQEASVTLRQVGWFAAVSSGAFLLPFVFTDLLDLDHDLYYLLYFAGAVGMVWGYVRFNDVDVRGTLTRNWKVSLAVGAASAAFVVWSVLARLDSTPHPTGAYFAFEIIWRGALYAMVDALLLSAFPGLVAWALMKGDIGGWGRRLGYGAITMALVVIITATYHAGYKDLRNADGIAKPEIGNTIISLPVVVSANPLGSFVAHTSMHLAAVTHSYESRDRLPPQTFVDPH